MDGPYKLGSTNQHGVFRQRQWLYIGPIIAAPLTHMCVTLYRKVGFPFSTRLALITRYIKPTAYLQHYVYHFACLFCDQTQMMLIKIKATFKSCDLNCAFDYIFYLFRIPDLHYIGLLSHSRHRGAGVRGWHGEASADCHFWL